MNKVKVGVAGLGRQGYGMHGTGLVKLNDEFQIVAACDLIEERRKRYQELTGCRVYECFEKLLADDEVELIIIATYSKDHCDHIIRALGAGKNVYGEKPFCLNYEEACRIRDAAKTAGGKLFIGQNRRFEGDFIKLREIMDSGVLGEIYEIQHSVFHYNRRDDWQTLQDMGGGQLYNWGPHLIDHALQLMDAPVVSMTSCLRQIAAVGDAEDHVDIGLTGANGRSIRLEIGGGVAMQFPKYIVYGTKGTAIYQDEHFTLKYLDPQKPLEPRVAIRESVMDTFGTEEDLPFIQETIHAPMGDLMEIMHCVYRSLRQGEAFPVSIDEAVEIMRIITGAKTDVLPQKQ